MRYMIYYLFFALTALSYGCSEATAHAEAPTPVREVRVATVEAIDFRETIRGAGRLTDQEEIRLSFKTGGVVQRILVDEGDRVRRGQQLAVLELDEIQAQNRQAELGVEKARIDLDNAQLALRLAERDYRNARGLYQDSVATLEQLENAEVQLDQTRNQLEAARKALALSEQNVEVADFNLRYATIVAPYQGTVLRKLAEPGEMVGPGNPVLLLGSNERTKVLKVDVTDREIIQLKTGTEAQITFDAYPGDAFRGEVTALAALADPVTGTYTVEVALTPQNKPLRSGFIGQVTMPATSTLRLLRVPIDAMVQGDGHTVQLFVLQDGRARQRLVTVVKMEDESLLLREGVQPGDTVITSGVGYLNDGQPVRMLQ